MFQSWNAVSYRVQLICLCQYIVVKTSLKVEKQDIEERKRMRDREKHIDRVSVKTLSYISCPFVHTVNTHRKHDPLQVLRRLFSFEKFHLTYFVFAGSLSLLFIFSRQNISFIHLPRKMFATLKTLERVNVLEGVRKG